MAQERERQTMASSTQQHAEDVDDHDPYGHGSSVAAWTAVGLVMVGGFLMSLAVAITQLWMFIVGVVVVVLGGISGKVLGTLGFGAAQPGSR